MSPRCSVYVALLVSVSMLACSRGDAAKAAALEKKCLDGAHSGGSGTACEEACNLGSAKGCIEDGDTLGTASLFMGDEKGAREGRELTLKGCKLQGDTEQTCQALKDYDKKYGKKPPDAPAMAALDAGSAVPMSPAERLEQHRKEMAEAAEAGRYADVCKGTPWFNSTICNWAAAKAAGKGVDRPNGELFRAYFGKEHWKHAYGRIVGDADKDGDYEVTVGGYNHHCVLDTTDTKYDTKGAFNLWVQEQPEPREVTLNSGNTQQWVVLEEAELARTLMDLAHAGGVEATAMAKNAMKLIAVYEPYTERKGELPTLPDAPVTTAAPTPSAVSSGAVPTLNVDSLPKAGTPGTAAPPSKPGVVAQAQPVTPTCPPGSSWNGSTCAGNATTCAVGMHFVLGQGCVPDVVAPAAVGTAPFDRGSAAAALGSVNLASCKAAGGPVGAGHVALTFSPDGSVSSAVVDRPPYAGTPTGACISNLFRAVHVRPFTGQAVRMGKVFAN